MPEKSPHDQRLKVTDKRMFTAEGEGKDEYRNQVTPSESPVSPRPSPRPEPPRSPEPPRNERRKTLRDQAANPGTPFSNFVEGLIIQAYMSLGMLSAPPPAMQGAVDLAAARQLIDLLAMLEEKTKGNLTEDESAFLAAHMGELKLAFVRRTKGL